jgi:hypothetical protein
MRSSLQERKDEIVRLYTDGASTPELALRFGASSEGVRTLLRRNGVQLRPRGGSARRSGADVDAEIVRLYVDERLTRQQIVARTGVSRETVLRRLHEAGVELRAKGTRAQTIRVPDDPMKLGYLAGMLDGEGNLQRRSDGQGRVGGKLAIYSTTAGVMDWLVDNVGGRVRWDQKRTERGWLPIGIWELYRARDIAAILTAVEPLLIVKRGTARELLELYRHRGISVH